MRLIAYSCLLVLSVLSFALVNSDNLYLEGFANPNALPGGPSDKRGIPNLPFTTDTNRLSDGVSSSDIYNNISPEFPIYNGTEVSSTLRYTYYVNYMANAALQGIAGYGAGDSVKENAKFSITSQQNYTSLPAPSINFSVDSSVKWNPSGFAIQEGESYQITVSGLQYWMDGQLSVDADGYSSFYDPLLDCFLAVGKCRSYLKKKRRFAANWMSLMCGIGQYVRPLGEIQPGNEAATYWLPLDESILLETLFFVGTSVSFLAAYSGELICFANDAHTLYWNNVGSLQVEATRMSWPPMNSTYYQELYLIACDSATAVYANGGTNVTNPVLKCNPNGGGSGWSYTETLNTTAHDYASGAPYNFTL